MKSILSSSTYPELPNLRWKTMVASFLFSQGHCDLLRKPSGMWCLWTNVGTNSRLTYGTDLTLLRNFLVSLIGHQDGNPSRLSFHFRQSGYLRFTGISSPNPNRPNSWSVAGRLYLDRYEFEEDWSYYGHWCIWKRIKISIFWTRSNFTAASEWVLHLWPRLQPYFWLKTLILRGEVWSDRRHAWCTVL